MNKKNYSSLTFIKNVFPLFLMLLFVNVGWGQYSGTGTFNKITNVADVTDGYYVIVDETDGFAMNNAHNGTYLGKTEVSPSANSLSNPTADIVWKIETNGLGKTIYNESSTKYVSYTGSSNNVQIVDAVVANNQRWIITYASSVFEFKNSALTTRFLQYNTSSPRFACYTGSQKDILLYKLTAPANTVPTVTDVAITGLPNTGVELMGSYVYSDVEEDVDASTFQWYMADDALGSNQLAIAGATDVNYTLTATELGKYIQLGVLAGAATGTTPGVEVYSPWIGPVNTAGTPVLNAGLLEDFASTCLSTTTSANSFTLMGNNLESNVVVNALPGFTFSLSENGTYTATLTIAPFFEELSVDVYVKFTPTAAQSYDGMISITGGGASALDVSVVASGINTPASATTDLPFGITSSAATVTGSLTEGCSVVTDYGFEYSTTENFVEGTGTSASASNLNAGNFTVSLSGLQSNTTYYYKAYATDGIGVVYGAQSSFMTTSIETPTANAGTAVNASGFTANWDAVAGATAYELDVYEVVPGTNATNLILSEYGEGSGGNKKYIEIFNGTGADVDLANYEIWGISNGGTWPESTISLTGTLLNNATYVIANNASDVLGATLYTTSLNYNGDDAVGLAWNGGTGTTFTLIDAVGEEGPDPGSGWSVAGTNNATVDKILIRKADVTSPTTNWATSAGTTVEDSQWIVSSFTYNSTANTTNLGSHSFSGGSSAALVVDGQNVGNVTSYDVTGLNSGSEYFYVVRAIDANSTSESSTEISVTTLEAATTYENGVWSNGVPTANINAFTVSNFTTTVDLEAKSLTVTSGIFTVATGTTLTVTNAIVNNSSMEGVDTFVVQNDAFVVQTSDVSNTGMFVVKRNSSNLFRQDYTLWSSPVTGQNLRSFSPETLFNRFSSYDTAAGTNGDYQQELFTAEDVTTKQFEIGKGYLIRMPNNWVLNENSNEAQSYLGSFRGNLNNGDLGLALSGANTKFNLVGNPYPSPISISAFFAGNPDIEQTLYFWRKTNGVAGSGYATSTGLGLTSAQPDVNGTSMDNTIKPGQGFLIQNKTATTLNFTNSMRSNTSGTLFLKSSNETPAELNRFWLNLSDANNVVGQTLVGYATGATQGVDSGLDAVYFNDSPLALTSVIENNEYVIQGRSLPFVDTDVVQLGFKSDIAAEFTIALANFDGLFAADQAIYLKDNLTGTLQNLKLAGYTFTTPIGVFNDRFEVQFTNSTLGTDVPVLAENSILIGVKNQQITINSGTVIIEKVELIDVSGRVIYTQEAVNASRTTLKNVVSTNQMLIVRINTKENNIVNQKIIF
ncbi:lamin tail domain-containing protein [Flavobacterium sp. SM2513]|uniref:lamin tail domain-containing protein n=1 Tax=Flavobacterium sp. SM2513 TaxID=3424766 RepID=UPI003D7FDA68